MELAAGTVIADRYRLERKLGQGGMGSVWAATHLLTRKLVAIKFLRKEAATPDVVRRFLREARAASAVRHPNVVQVHDVIITDQGEPVMIMDYLQGESLGGRLAREQKLPLDQLARILLPVASAIGTAHAAGVVHRDLKPDNIFLERSPEGTIIPKVLDFGIAKVRPLEGQGELTGSLTHTGAMLGTPYYMAPEQAFGESDVDQRVDVWAFGIILWECLAGHRPVDGDNLGQLLRILMTGIKTPLQEVAPEVPAELAALVHRMLSLDREKRPKDMREVFAVLRRYTDVTAATFAEAGQVVLTESAERSFSADLELAATESAGALASSTLRAPSRRLPLWALGAGLLTLAGLAFSGMQWFRPGAPRAASSGLLNPELVSGIGPQESAEAFAADAGHGAEAGTVAVADAAVVPRPRQPEPPRGTSAPGATGAPDPGATAAATPAATPVATPSTKRLPGGVVSAAPF